MKPYSVIIEMKASDLVLSCGAGYYMLKMVVPSSESMDEIINCVTIQMKTAAQYFPTVYYDVQHAGTNF